MPVRIFVGLAAIAALALGASVSSATLASSTSSTVKIKRANAPASLSLKLSNVDDAVVPQPITTIKLSSRNAKWNSRAVPQCKWVYPNPADGNHGYIDPLRFACPASKVGSGTYSLNTGTAGQQIPADLGYLNGTVNVYNYKHAKAEAAVFIFEFMSDIPVPNAYDYVKATVSKSGVVTIPTLEMELLNPAVKNILSPPNAPRVTSLTGLRFSIKSPRPKGHGAPLLTFADPKKATFRVELQRAAQ